MDIDLIDSSRPTLTFEQMRQVMGWSWGEDGEWVADLWRAYNDRHWEGALDPVPIWFPRATPYGRWLGLCTGNSHHQTQHIQLKHGCSLQEWADILIHEMVHQALLETRRNPNHNARPWCDEIMRLSKEIWGQDIWAAPSLPRKVDGKSQRIQKRSPDGEESISRKAIASWPHSLGLHVEIGHYL